MYGWWFKSGHELRELAALLCAGLWAVLVAVEYIWNKLGNQLNPKL